MTLGIVVAYLVLVLAIGVASNRLFKGTSEDFFVAARTIGPVMLLISLFGANMTAFAILGASGEGYLRGIGVFALMASSSGLIIPLVFLYVGTRVRALGQRHGFYTPVQFFRERWGSDLLGLVLFVVLVALLVPYLLIGVMGGGSTLTQITDGRVPGWVGGLVICVVVLAYTAWGGLRGTIWVNAFQTVVLLLLGAVTFAIVAEKMGGLRTALGRVGETAPDLLVRGHHIEPLELLTYTFIPLSVGTFPHMFLHWLSAKRASSFRLGIALYPLCIAVVWVPSVLLGVLAAVDFPERSAAAANGILVRLIDLHAPGLLAGLLAAAVFAAIMNSFDSQVLALGTMFTHDIVRHYGFHDAMGDRQQINVGRIFTVVILAATYVLSLYVDRSIFRLGVWCFSGFAALFPVIVAALYWRRSTWQGALASTLVVAGLWFWFVLGGGAGLRGLLVGGIMPVALMLAASTVAMVVGSLLSPRPDPARVARFI